MPPTDNPADLRQKLTHAEAVIVELRVPAGAAAVAGVTVQVMH